MRIKALGTLVLLLLLVACAEGVDAGTTTSSSTTLSTTTTTIGDTTSTIITTTTAGTTTTSQEIDVFYEGGQVVGPGRIAVPTGSEVSVWVLSDTDDEVHVHGYDLLFPLKAGVPLEIAFTADVPGIFEVELESSHTPLFELEVSS